MIKNNKRYSSASIDHEFNLDAPARVLLLGGDESTRAEIERTLSTINDVFDVATFADPELFANDDTDADTVLSLLIASGDSEVDSQWFTHAAEIQSPGPVVLIDTGNAAFNQNLGNIAWRHLNAERGGVFRNELDAALQIGYMRLALQQSRSRQSLTTAGIASILNQDAGASAILEGTTLIEPTSALAGLLGADSVAQLDGADIREWIKQSDTSIFHDVLKRARRDAEPADVVVRIVPTNDVDYGVRVFLAPPASRKDHESFKGDMQLVMASAGNCFRAGLPPAYHDHAHIGGRMALHSDLAAPHAQTKGDGWGLVAAQIDNLRHIEDRYGLAATDQFAHHFGLAFAEALEAGDHCYQLDTGRYVAFVERDSRRAIGETAKTLQTALTNRPFDEEDDNTAIVTASVCYIELDEGRNTGWSHDERLWRIVRGVEALSRLGGNRHQHHEDVAVIDADKTEVTGHAHLTVAQTGIQSGTDATFDDGRQTASADKDDTADKTEEESDSPPMSDTPPQPRATDHGDSGGPGQSPWTKTLREALANDGFSLAYQGVTGLSGSDKPYFDVLLRYVDADGNLIEAGEFLPDAARSGLMPEIDRWVTGQTIDVVGDQRDSNKPIGLFVKLSPLLLPHAKDFVAWLTDTAGSRQIERSDLIFSFRESDINTYGEPIESLISRLSHEGFKTALTHVSSTQEASNLLTRLPFTFVKLSAAFAHSIISDDDDRPLQEMVSEMRRHEVPLIAEQIENADAMAKLWQAGINYVQGNFIQEPDTQTFRRQKTHA